MESCISCPYIQSGGLKGLLSDLGQQIQSAYVSVVSAVKSTPTTTLGLAREGTGGLLQTLGSARQYLLEMATHYGLVSRPPPPDTPSLLPRHRSASSLIRLFAPLH